MVSVGRHENITLLTYSEVEKVSGMVGHFTVQVRKKARFVDEDQTLGRESGLLDETSALLHDEPHRHLEFHPDEHPVGVQLGGSEPQDLAECARLAERHGYDEINLNIGCPSERVQRGAFGACLMAEPLLVGDCVAAMKQAVAIPVTVKCRIGVDEQDPEAALDALTAAVKAAGVDALIVHARKAWLQGLSPKENREIPPLRYEWVHRLKRERPDLRVLLNGGLVSVEDVRGAMEHVDGVMIGRAAQGRPWIFREIDHYLQTGELLPEPPRQLTKARPDRIP